ncbi:MAG: histidinol-phosphate transaminase [Phyllobacterium sp.]
MNRLWSPLVGTLKPYEAGEQPDIANLVKLNTNENPHGPSPKALAAMQAAVADTLRLYPDPSALALRGAIARSYRVLPDEVFVGNGSDEVLAHAFAALLKHDKPLLHPDITYSFYPAYCRLFGIEAVEIPLDDDFRIDPGYYDRPCGAIILPNPNAPTGIGLPLSSIEALVAAHAGQPVVIDEAYIDFGGESAIPLTRKYDNLLVVHTLSKSRSLAGLRVGYAIGQRPLIDALERVKDSFNSYPLGRIAQAGAAAAIEDKAWFDKTRHAVMATRDRLSGALRQRGFEVLPSQANFVFVRHPDHGGAALTQGLRERAVLVRHFDKPRISDFLRITIGTPEQCEALMAALDDSL